MPKTIRARIRFLLPSEGGRSTPPLSGIRPHLKLGEIFTTCVVRSDNPAEAFELGRSYDVNIDIIFWDEYGHLLHEKSIDLFDGNRLIAQGEIVSEHGS